MSRHSVSLLVCLFLTFLQNIVVCDKTIGYQGYYGPSTTSHAARRNFCKKVVKIVTEDENRWVADVRIKDAVELEGVWLNITLDSKAQLMANEFGTIVTKDNKSFLIKKLGYNLPSKKQQAIRIMVQYTGLSVPFVNKVLLNGLSLCPASIRVEENITCPSPPPPIAQQTSHVVVGGRVNIPEVNVKEVCGTVTIERDKIQNGFTADEGHYPWQLAINETVREISTYICSAALISQKYAVTAAHCVTKKNGVAKATEKYTLHAGSVHLNSNSENVQQYLLSSIDVHPDYNPQFKKNDIAILGLNALAHITDFVRPLCLPNENMTQSELYNKRGTVAGWGYTENGLVNDLEFARMSIIPPSVCVLANRVAYAPIISEKVLCVGGKNGTSVCSGDSGASIAVEDGSTGEDRFYTRGIVSLNPNSFGRPCTSNDYIIFTDVSSHLPWIKTIVDV